MISLVLPCRNQADHIGSLLPRYLRALETLGTPFEIVVVPNQSRDATQAVVEDLARTDSRLRIVPLAEGGWGRSVRAGLDAARGSILAYTNAARTSPESLPMFLDLYRQHPGSLVKARRVERHAPLRSLGSALYNLEARLLFGVASPDVNGTPKVFSETFYQSTQLVSLGDLLDLELMAHAERASVAVHDIPVAGFRRHGGRSTTNLRSAWRMYLGAVRLRLACL